MIIEQLRNLLILVVVVAVVIAVNMVYKPNNPICPLDFKEEDEYVESVASWLDDYYQKNPQASKEEVLKVRMDYLLESGCVDMKRPGS